MLIREIFESLNLDSCTKLGELVANNASGSIIAMPSTAPRADGLPARSRIGGLPDLACDYPRDRAGRPLLFVAQINFADLSSIQFSESDKSLPAAEKNQEVRSDDSLSCQSSNTPRSGLLSIFWNERKDASNPKDRHSFRIIWSELSPASPRNTDEAITICDPIPLAFTNHWSVPANICKWKNQNGSAAIQPASNDLSGYIDPAQIQQIIDQNTSSFSKAICVLCGHGDSEINRKREIAAFASNGVSWSPARSADSCYSHLVEAARDWLLLLRLNSMPELGFDLGSTKSISLLIHKNDLKENRLDKAWMVY